jgi:hypothetical protein
MWWPFRFTPHGAQAPPVSASSLPASHLPSSPLPSDRPVTGLELIWGLVSDFKKAGIFVFLVGSLLVIAAACIGGDCFVIMAAARELKGVSVPTTVSIDHVCVTSISGYPVADRPPRVPDDQPPNSPQLIDAGMGNIYFRGQERNV